MSAYTRHSTLSTAPPLLKGASRLWLVLFLALLPLAGGLGCGGGAAQQAKPSAAAETPDNVLWDFAAKALHLTLTAAKDLNAYDGKAHSLQLCVYQLDKRDAFDPLAGAQDGLNTLLQCSSFDKSVKSAVRIFMQPGETAVHALDRAEGAQFVGIVCGYFESVPEHSVKLLQISPKTTQSGHLFWKSTTYGAGSLDLSLHLGDHAMAEDKGKPDPDAKGAKNK